MMLSPSQHWLQTAELLFSGCTASGADWLPDPSFYGPSQSSLTARCSARRWEDVYLITLLSAVDLLILTVFDCSIASLTRHVVGLTPSFSSLHHSEDSGRCAQGSQIWEQLVWPGAAGLFEQAERLSGSWRTALISLLLDAARLRSRVESRQKCQAAQSQRPGKTSTDALWLPLWSSPQFSMFQLFTSVKSCFY